MLNAKRLILPLSSALLCAVYTPAFAAKNLILNGNFSVSATPCSPAVTSIPDWTVVSGNVDTGGDCTPPLSPPPGSSYFLDLTGSYAVGASDVGTISQTVTTVVGQAYNLSFYFGGNPQWQLSGLPNDSALKAMVVFLNGAISGVYSVNTNGVATDDGQWKRKIISFTATSTSTTISFESLNGSTTNPSDFGPLLGKVILVAVSASAAE